MKTSGFAVVANALIPVPWKTLLRPALCFPATSEGEIKKTRGEKQDREEHGSVRLRDLKQLGEITLEALASREIAGGSCQGVGEMLVGQVRWEQMET